MADFPDFQAHGYQIESELGANRAGGRVTYRARRVTSHAHGGGGNDWFVIKQFQFAQTQRGWSDFDTYQREIEVLQSLEHPGIPRYVEGFQTDTGFCMVQEYKSAEPLSSNRSFSPDQVRTIAIAVLKILVYLQSRMPPVIHRDIKPDNVLVDESLNVYLVDFGFARVGGGEVGVSSVVKGTLGFMPPEQLFNRQLSEASDLYGLGMTLVCLLTGTKPDDIGNLVDISYRVKFKHLVPKIDVHWVKWLERMVEPRLQDRYADAVTALQAMPNCPLFSPKVRLSQSSLAFAATQVEQTLVQTLDINNIVPGTELQGAWEIVDYASDRPRQDSAHPWISVEPQWFRGNQSTVTITVDTRRLMSDRTYERTLRLKTNALPETYSIALTLKTAPVYSRQHSAYWRSLGLVFCALLFISRGVYWLGEEQIVLDGNWAIAAFSLLAGTGAGLELSAWTLTSAGLASANVVAALGAAMGLSTLVLAWFLVGQISGKIVEMLLGCGIGIIAGWLMGIVIGLAINRLTQAQLRPRFAAGAVVSTGLLGSLVSLGLTVGFAQPAVLLALVATGMVLGSYMLRISVDRTRIALKQKRSPGQLIRP
ncbi:MAG: serine/threonine-protein kinase [Cyanobacteria bacterium P01_D01_bin.128]